MRTVPIRVDDDEVSVCDLAVDWKESPKAVLEQVNTLLAERGLKLEFVVQDNHNDMYCFDLVVTK